MVLIGGRKMKFYGIMGIVKGGVNLCYIWVRLIFENVISGYN